MPPGPPRPPGVGLDLLEIDRLEAALARRPALAARLFTDAEQAYAAARRRPGQHLAARFCAKEAVAKALGLRAWSWRDIEVVTDGGPPRIVLHGPLSALGASVDVSLTHSRETAGAVAVVR
ncbi:holo-ACP synthase [Baekduia soli]|uniref:Holo-[acyl-carrier-protein] synthase n=1 Tax=Baekduia soli TaxID=496014 RepID=A0A5B8UCV7_9ACTN|nr:holo-ACP synthase [Baekduia soli]QEC50870.1 holo-ACP synthase [Baekduia soli]